MTQRDHDVVIIGSGLAGMCAAGDLRSFDTLLLEREPRPGGRVLTRHHRDISYDLGALFAYPERQLRVPGPRSEIIEEQGPVGMFRGGKLHVDRDVIACIRSCVRSPEWPHTSRRDESLDRILEFRQTHDIDVLSPEEHAIVNAFFHVTHPGKIDDYIHERRADGLRTYPVRHHVHGNGVLIEHLRASIGERLVLGADVHGIDDRGDHVLVRYQTGEEMHTVRARSALVCTPAPITRSLLSQQNDEARYFLDNVHYQGGLVVVLTCARELVRTFSYLVAVDAQPNTIIRQVKGDTCVLTCYYVGTQAHQLAQHTDEAILDHTVQQIRTMGLGLSSREQLRFADVHYWPHIGPIISEPMRAYFHSRALRPSERVFLAGDYTAGGELPYGMHAAMESGHRAATDIKALLEPPTRASGAQSRPVMEPLTYTYRYALRDDRPVFLECRAEGDVAFYGLVLQARPDDRIRDHLLASRRDGLWEYHRGYGITTEDSTLVIEGLWRAGVSPDELLPSLQRLVERCFEQTTGAFHTIPIDRAGRAGYWRGPSIDATAHAGYLLHSIAPERFAEEVQACGRFVRAQQQPDGSFSGRWFPSWTWTTYYAVRVSLALGHTDVVQRAHWALLRAQDDGGSWNGSVIDTATAVLALMDLDEGDPAIERGRSWLRAQRQTHGWAPEAVLYYWFERETHGESAIASGPEHLGASSSGWYDADEPQRVFFHGMDRGQITTSWALLALQPRKIRLGSVRGVHR